MRRSLPFLGALIAALAINLAVPRAQAEVIHNTFGPGDTWDTVGGGYTVRNEGGTVVRTAGRFTPTGNFYLDTIELALELLSGPNAMDVWLTADANDAPGAVIETFSFSDALLPQPGSIVSAASTLHPFLGNGTLYWLVASAPTPGTIGVWNWVNYQENITGYMSQWQNGFGWSPSSNAIQPPAFRVSGSPVNGPVPEPATMLLLAAALIGLAGFRKKCQAVGCGDEGTASIACGVRTRSMRFAMLTTSYGVGGGPSVGFFTLLRG